ncbi:MAG: hypothetical protein ABIQ95_10260 [Bdellovibrionia bacterium]
MNPILRRNRLRGLAIFLLFLKCPLSWAEINFQDMKGVHDLIHPKYQNLSPIYGLALLGTRSLENLRFYGNYGPKKEGFGCLDKSTRLHELLVKNRDCPQDKTSEFIQRLFPSQDGANFVANQLDSDPISKMKPKLIGNLIIQMAQVPNSDLDDPEKVKALKLEMKKTLFENLNPLSYYEGQRTSAKRRLRELNRQEKKKSSSGVGCGDCYEVEKSKLQAQLISIQNVQKALNPGMASSTGTSKSSATPSASRKGVGKEIDFEEFANLLVDALKESRIDGGSLISNLPELVLMAYFWKKGNEKQDFIALLKGMSEGNHQTPPFLKDPKFLETHLAQKQFLAQKYVAEDYEPGIFRENSAREVKNLLVHPELLAFFVEQEKLADKSLPPILTYGQASHSSLLETAYPDCGETSLRNFVNITLFDREKGKFDSRILEELEKANPQLQINPNLVSFYRKHSDPAVSVSQVARDEWSETVASKHEGVVYNKPSAAPACEISSAGGGIDNMMSVLEHLLFRGKQGTDQKNGAAIQPNSKQLSRADRLDALCKGLSRDGFVLDWKLKEGGDEDPKKSINSEKFGMIEFSINDTPSFVWHFMEGHFRIENVNREGASWKEIFAGDFATFQAKLAKFRAKEKSQEHTVSPLVLNWFAEDLVFTGLFKPAMVYGLPLSSEDDKVLSIGAILAMKDPLLYPMGKKLSSQIPQNDHFSQKNMASMLANNDYPWGDPPHVKGRPNVTFTRLSKNPEKWEELLHQNKKNVLDERAQKEFQRNFEKAWIDPHGLVWSNALQDSSSPGGIHKMKWKEANDYCKLIGTRLPTQEDWDNLTGYLGGHTSFGYIPEFLPHLNGNEFWSSTEDSNSSTEYHYFHGTHGVARQSVARDYDLAVRCVL